VLGVGCWVLSVWLGGMWFSCFLRFQLSRRALDAADGEVVMPGVCGWKLSALTKPGCTKHSGTVKLTSETAPEDPTTDAFTVASACLKFEITTSRPLNDKPLIKVSDVLTKRPAPPVGSHLPDATHEFRSSARKVLAQLLTEYQSFSFNPSLTSEQRRQEFFYHLNSSGIFQAFRERLKAPVQKVVKEKFHKTAEAVHAAAAESRTKLPAGVDRSQVKDQSTAASAAPLEVRVQKFA
jgi:hypothetical protein